MFNRDMLKGLNPNDPPPTIPENAHCIRIWDKAYREPSEKNMYPDYTASIKMYKDSLCNLYIVGDFHEDLHDNFKEGEDIIYGRFRKNVGLRNEWMLKQAYKDGKDCTVVIPEEGGAGAGEFEQLRAMFKQEGFKVQGAKAGNQKGGKAKRFSTFCAEAEQGMVYILPETFGNRATLHAFLSELEKFDPEPDGTWRSTGTIKDDWVDVCGDGTIILQKAKVHKAVRLPRANSPTALAEMKNSLGTGSSSNKPTNPFRRRS